MRLYSVKQILAFSLLGLCSTGSFADAAPPQSGASFATVCVDTWMKKGGQASDKVDYKNFGEKYCTCASTQPLDSDAAIKKAIQICMSRTLLHDAMDSLEEEVGLSEAKDTDVMEYCQDRWNLIYPNQTDADKKVTGAYCECAKPKLLDLLKQSDNITDSQYSESIDNIAAACSGNVKDDQANTSTGANPPKN